MAFSAHRKVVASNYPSLGPDDYLSDELPDYSSRRSSFNGDNKGPFGPESDRHRKVSTASNMLEVPGYSLYDRQNSMGSTASLVSNTSGNTFSYRNMTKPKVKNAFGGIIVMVGLCLLVLGILLLIFGHTTDNAITIESTSIASINYNNNSSTYESINNKTNNGTNNTTFSNSYDNNTNQIITNGYHVSAVETIGYFALFSGILLILIGISIICIPVKELQKPNPNPQNPNIHFKRRVSTIEIEPQNIPNEIPVTKPEIMITPDGLKDKVTYKKYQGPQPMRLPRPSISTDLDDQFSPKSPKEYQKKFPF